MSVTSLIPAPFRSLFRRLAWNAIGLTAVTASGMKLRITSPSDWYVFNEIFVKGEYDKAIVAALANTSGRMNVIDLGANVGFFSLRVLDLLRTRGRHDVMVDIVAIEGSPTCYRQLTTTMREAGVNGTVRHRLGLVGLRWGEGVLHESSFGARSSMVRSERGGSTTVPFIDLNTIVAPGTTIDLLKCDIEGAEELFIENYPGLIRQTRVAVFELHQRLCDSRRCVQLLAGAGMIMQEDRRAADDTAIITFVQSRLSQTGDTITANPT